MLALGNRTSLADRYLVAYLCGIALVMHEEFLASALVFFVLGVLDVGFDLNGRRVFHSSLYNDTLKNLARLFDDSSLCGLILLFCSDSHTSD